MTGVAVQAAAGWGFPGPDHGGYALPATDAQVGALHQQFARLGFAWDDRAERLDAAAALLGIPTLGSFRELTLGKAGWLLWHASRCATRAELDEAVACALGSAEEDQEQAVMPGWGGVLAACVQILAEMGPGWPVQAV